MVEIRASLKMIYSAIILDSLKKLGFARPETLGKGTERTNQVKVIMTKTKLN